MEKDILRVSKKSLNWKNNIQVYLWKKRNRLEDDGLVKSEKIVNKPKELKKIK